MKKYTLNKLPRWAFAILSIYLTTPNMSNSQILSPSGPLQKDTVYIEIWTDVVCPFCYLGKKNLEAAFRQLHNQHAAQITWRSFQLNPHLETDTSYSITAYLAKTKGIEVEEVNAMYRQITSMAEKAGIQFNLENAILANSGKAHSLGKFAAMYGKQSQVMEDLFQAYFTFNQNIDDQAFLDDLAAKHGLNTSAFHAALADGSLARQVEDDQTEASRLGISGVPFFVFNRQYAISGAQEPDVFRRFLQEKFD